MFKLSIDVVSYFKMFASAVIIVPVREKKITLNAYLYIEFV